MKLQTTAGNKTGMIRHYEAQRGYTLLQLLTTLAIVSVVTSFAMLGISSARASVRLQNSTRQLATYVERVRSDALRRHAIASVQLVDATSYSVTMDFADSGSVTTNKFSLENGITFITALQSITFDWRGRTPSEISIGLSNGTNTSNINISGSGDVTIDSAIFHDGAVPNANLNANLSPGLIPDPNPAATAVPTATPTPSNTPTPTPIPTPTPQPTSTPPPSATPAATPTPAPTPTSTATPTPAPTATPTPVPCSLAASPVSLAIGNNGSGSVSVHLNNFSGAGTITAASSSSGQIQVSPASRSVTGSSTVTFIVTVKKQSGSVTFSSSCGSKTVSIVVN
jgi:Tfp pilus assembly protein FimT